MADDPCPVAVTSDSFKKKCVWFNELGFKDSEVKCQNQNIVVLRGAGHEVVHCALQRKPSRLAREEMGQGNLRFINLSCAAALLHIDVTQSTGKRLRIIHGWSLFA